MKRRILILCLCLGVSGSAIAQEAPARLDFDDSGITFADESIIPIPVEIFNSLDKLGARDWSQQVVDRHIHLDTNRSRTAMLFGLVVSEGFIAVQARDKEGVRRTGRDVLKLAGSLGVAEEVEEHANSIVTSAGRDQWEAVRRELDRTRQTVIEKMKELRDDELVALVRLGGWLGGTEALAAVLEDDYSPEASDLLNQPDLVDQLNSDFNGLPKRARRGELFMRVARTLRQLESLMRSDDSGAISQGHVEEISLATSDLVEAIYDS